MAKAHHAVPLWVLFLLLLFFTAAEVGLYEAWKYSAQHDPEPFMPKVAMVLVVLVVLTLPKALIVLVWFMHLRFEKQMIVALALTPFAMAAIAVLPMLSDSKALKDRAYNFPRKAIGLYAAEHTGGAAHGSHAPAAAPAASDDEY